MAGAAEWCFYTVNTSKSHRKSSWGENRCDRRQPTDSGVHALGQVAVFDTDKNIPDWKYALAINQRLPKDIVVQKSEEVSLDFHPRYTDVEKTYEYRILNRRTQLPKERYTVILSRKS